MEFGTHDYSEQSSSKVAEMTYSQTVMSQNSLLKSFLNKGFGCFGNRCEGLLKPLITAIERTTTIRFNLLKKITRTDFPTHKHFYIHLVLYTL